jgi:hypothetical protein
VGGLVFLALFLWLLSWDNRRQDAAPEPGIRVRAKEILRAASRNLVQAKTGSGFPDDPRAAFEGSAAFSCEGCLHYVFALQESCEDGGNLRFYQPSELSLSDDLKGTLTTIHQDMESLSFPCKPAAQGFNLFAAGMASPNSSMDILLVGEDGDPRVIEDGFAAGPEAP